MYTINQKETLGMWFVTLIPSRTWEVEAGRSGVQGHSQPHRVRGQPGWQETLSQKENKVQQKGN